MRFFGRLRLEIREDRIATAVAESKDASITSPTFKPEKAREP
jgi:hypothetical protein